MQLKRANPTEDTWEYFYTRSKNWQRLMIEPFGDDRFCDGMIVDKFGRMALYECKTSEELMHPQVIEASKEKMRFLNCGLDLFLLDGHPQARWFRKLTRNPGIHNKHLDIIHVWSALGTMVPKTRSKKHNIVGHTYHPFCGPDWGGRPTDDTAIQCMDPNDVALMNEITGYYQKANCIPDYTELNFDEQH